VTKLALSEDAQGVPRMGEEKYREKRYVNKSS
jgi:hypothetical protein